MNTKNAPTVPPAKSAAKPTLPVHTLRLGRIKAAIWENEADAKKFYNVTFARSYRTTDGKWHDADSFGRDDLLLVAKLANEAHSYIWARMDRSDDGPQP